MFFLYLKSGTFSKARPRSPYAISAESPESRKGYRGMYLRLEAAVF